MKVLFHVAGEFIEEMHRDRGKIDRNLIRVTIQRKSHLTPNIHQVIVLATYSVEGQVVELKHYCGDNWGLNSENDIQTNSRAEGICKTITKEGEGLKMEIRPGYLTE